MGDPKANRCVRFGLRELGLIVFVVACLLSVLVRPHRQRATVNMIRQLGGTVTRFHSGDYHDTALDETGWLRTLLGEQFIRVGTVDLSESSVTDDDLKRVCSLKDIRVLSLDRTEISDDGIIHIAGLPNLEQLNVEGTRVSLQAMASLRHMESLERVKISGLDLSGRELIDDQAIHRKLQVERRANVVSHNY